MYDRFFFSNIYPQHIQCKYDKINCNSIKEVTRTHTSSDTHYIAKDNLPIHSVEKNGFKKLLHTFEGRYEVPTRSYFSKTALSTLYTTTDRVRREISTITPFLSHHWPLGPMKDATLHELYCTFCWHWVETPEQMLRNTVFTSTPHWRKPLLNQLTQIGIMGSRHQVSLTTDNGAATSSQLFSS